jgi:hypothetical protein
MSASGLYVSLRPYLWLAAAAFAAGFIGYARVDAPRPAAKAEPAAHGRTASAPSSADWNLPKHV